MMRKNKSIRYIWLITYIAILLIPMVTSIIFYGYIEKEFSEQVHSYNSSLNNSRSQRFDNIVDEIQKIGTEISYNTRIDDIIRYDINALSPEENFEIYKLSAELKTYMNVYSGVKNVYVYFPKDDAIIAATGIHDTDRFYQNDELYGDYGREEIISQLNKRYIGNFVKTVDNENGCIIVYITSVANIGMEDILANVVIEVNQEYINSIISDDEEGISGFLICDNDKIITQKYNRDIDGIIDLADFQDEDLSSFVKPYNGVNYVISCIPSEISSLKYVYISDENIINAKISRFKIVCLLVFLSCIIVSIFVVRYFLKKNYRPINILMQTVENITGQNRSRKNEFDYIESSVLKINDKRKEFENRLLKQEYIIRNNAIKMLLKPQILSSATINEVVDSADIGFKDTYFVVILFCIDDVHNIFFDSNSENEDSDFEYAKIVISNIVTELLRAEDIRCEASDAEGLLCCVLNFDDTALDERVTATIRDAKEYIKKRFNIDFTAIISNIHKNFLGISAAYQDTLDILKERFVLWNKSIIQYSDIEKDLNCKDIYYYPYDIEEKITNCIRAGELATLISIINDLFYINFEKKQLRVQIAKCFTAALTNTIIKVAVEVLAEKDISDKLLGKIEEILDCRSIKEIKEKIVDFCRYVCEDVVQKNINKSSQELSDKIKAYISENYSNADLNIMNVAENIHMNANYIANIFRQQNGIGMLEYIAKLRIDKAKEIMRSGNISNEELCKMVGFTNVRTFSRTFTKYVGVSPGKYKKHLADN